MIELDFLNDFAFVSEPLQDLCEWFSDDSTSM